MDRQKIKKTFILLFLSILVPGKVEGLESIYRAGNFIIVKWQEPLITNGEIIGYDVEYEESK